MEQRIGFIPCVPIHIIYYLEKHLIILSLLLTIAMEFKVFYIGHYIHNYCPSTITYIGTFILVKYRLECFRA